VITSESPFTLSFQNQQKVFEAGEVLELTSTSGYLADGRVVISSNVENGKLQITSITRNGVYPSYRGTIEVAPYGDGGLTIVNELSLEEYLYTVVPSEMPTSYGNVALEVQAICARGYAYMKMQDGTYAKYGAHVDDSTMTQVYNAVGETEEAILAVKETYGMVPTYDGSVIQAYFFSTSCGTTCTNADVWDGEPLPYLQDSMECITTSEAEGTDDETVLHAEAANLSEESAFRSFIDDSSSYHTFEQDCSLYRWSIEYTKEEMTNAINATLSTRYAANPDKILTLQSDGSYQSQSISTVGEVEEIRITKRGNSGIVKEIQVVGSQATILVSGQTNARALMTPADVTIKRQDGSESIAWSLIPSPFYYVTVNDAGNYVIVGGGFGHGVGMSQNGAKALADMGYSAEAIIKHYYTGIELMNIYQ
jgi:stage II sporulation protein D